MTKEIVLYRNKGIALVDDIDYEYLTANDWNWCFQSGNGYAIRYYKDDTGKRGSIFQHRVIMTRILGEPIARGMQVDHIDQNRLNNTRENLRLASRSENQWNKNVAANNSTGYKGVTAAGQGKYDAHIKVYRRRIYLGRFSKAEEAGLMYDIASRDLHGEFSHPNLPDQSAPFEIEERWQRLLTRQPDIANLIE